MNSFDAALKLILAHEGGYVNDPRDPGGETAYGISRRAYPNVNIRALTPESAGAIYKRDYWDACGCGQLEPALALCVFDSAVNHGTGRAKQWLGQHGDDWQAFMLERHEFYTDLGTFDTFGRGWMRRWVATWKAALALLSAAPQDSPSSAPSAPIQVRIFDPATNKQTGTGSLIGDKVYLKKEAL